MMMALSYQDLNQKYWKKFPRERMAERKRHMLALSKPCILIEIHVKKGKVLRKKSQLSNFFIFQQNSYRRTDTLKPRYN